MLWRKMNAPTPIAGNGVGIFKIVSNLSMSCDNQMSHFESLTINEVEMFDTNHFLDCCSGGIRSQVSLLQ